MRAISVNAAHYKILLTQKIRSSPNNSIGYSEMTNVFRDELTQAAQKEIKAFDDTDLFRTPAQKIISMLKEI